ncbi:hypothetical protein AB0G60_02875 [Streptomyces angustmyceticus]|uniref:Uncharacterized protein n=1 Tax=Streptomyces angustmyceticus TaxID=285578 RepID=A0A5J4L190_9ACTN|nr:hypothetical protein [Streptomyces angustmyceticus]UAL65605.1 hypothetical protein K7396_02840 [Streptomyces angustmyceticus]GES27873.1 hypothetical protein San01_03600 [Streptomyces angustmyceticus]
MTDDLRQRLSEAIDDCRTLTPEALADAVFGVVHPELDRLNQEVDYLKRNIRRSRDQVDGYDQELTSAKAAIARMRALHQPTQHMGQTWCTTCSTRRRTGPDTEEWVAYIPHPCPTIDAIEETP